MNWLVQEVPHSSFSIRKSDEHTGSVPYKFERGRPSIPNVLGRKETREEREIIEQHERTGRWEKPNAGRFYRPKAEYRQ